ncbi:MAG: zf-HC2 domain-containing protein [Acidobacteriota bacterium]|nr:zf-HC2 domain-containing protein [Acidobacteriota bacterium]
MKHYPSAELLALDALDALDPQERSKLHSHVGGCSACRAELRALREVSAALAFTVEPVEPPAALRLRVFRDTVQSHDHFHRIM